MGSRMHSEVRSYGVYAIVAYTPDEGDIVHVWRTRTTDLRKVLSNHRRKEGIMEPFFEDGVEAEIYLLERVEATLATTYRHVLAWSRYFADNEYEVIAPLKTYEAVFDLQPETEEIYRRICAVPISALLEHPYRHIKAVTPPIEEKAEQEPLSERLSIRLTPTEYRQFRQLSTRENLTYRETLVSLLAQHDKENLPAAALIRAQKERIERQQEEIEKARNPRGARTDERLKQALSFCQRGVRAYIRLICDRPRGKPECPSWNQTVVSFPGRRLYQYPTEDGFFIFQLERMCYGRGTNAAIFLYGLDLDRKKKVVLRYYDKKEYCGVKPPYNGFFLEGTQFLAGCRVAQSGAADLLAAFPISWPEETREERSLDDILSGAQYRSELKNG